jgi:hypothetical protein
VAWAGFGCPRATDAALAARLEALVPELVAVRAEGDPVPGLPCFAPYVACPGAAARPPLRCAPPPAALAATSVFPSHSIYTYIAGVDAALSSTQAQGVPLTGSS